MKKKTNIAFAGGSTGGHVVPISSLIQYLASSSQPLATSHQPPAIYRFGEKNSLEEREAKELSNQMIEAQKVKQHSNSAIRQLTFVTIVSGKFRRQANWKEWIQNIFDFFKFGRGIVVSFYNLKKYRIDVIFSKGGFVSLPVVIAGWLAGIRIIVHESDSKPGISTRIAARFATKVFTGFPDVFSGGEYVGQILSDSLLPATNYKLPATDTLSPKVGIEDQDNKIDGKLEARSRKPFVLVNCGSLGSASVHEALLKLFSHYPSLTQDFHRTVLLGKLNAGFFKEYEKYPEVIIYDYVDQKKMGELYRASDISVCRGGSTSLVEQHLFGIKQVIIPIPRTHDQAGNAAFFEREYGDIVIDQNIADWQKQLHLAVEKLRTHKKSMVDYGEVEKKIRGGKERIIGELLYVLLKP